MAYTADAVTVFAELFLVGPARTLGTSHFLFGTGHEISNGRQRDQWYDPVVPVSRVCHVAPRPQFSITKRRYTQLSLVS